MRKKIRRHILFYGRVQGVGFRYYAVQKARQLRLTGWVRNLYDGSVEMEVQGEECLIGALIMFLEQQRYVLIEKIDTKRISVIQEHDFCEL
ncbi:MAG: acylphosphatase [Roseburia sp.]